MPIETPAGTLEVENAKFRASSVEATIAVGIGTESNDAYPLQIFKETAPDIRLSEGSTISSAARFYSNNSNLYIQTGTDFTTGSSGDVAFQTMGGQSTHMVIKSDGKVGVGTTSPSATLHINSTDSVIIPSGTDAQRNGTPVNGMLRLNTTQNAIEYYYGNWTRLSTQVGAPIVTNGLMVQLDASDYNSYTGTGTTWYDISGNGRNGTLQGSVSWTNAGRASYFDFPGANADYIRQTSGGTKIYKDICIVFNVDAMNNSFGYLISRSTTADVSLRVGSSTIGNPGNNGDWSDNVSGSNGITYYVNGVADTDNVSISNEQWYILGGENTNDSLLGSAWNYYLGTGYTQGTRNLNGKIAFVALYDRVLTAAEQLQNYNALKARFGV
jgi:hypothetical protein